MSFDEQKTNPDTLWVGVKRELIGIPLSQIIHIHPAAMSSADIAANMEYLLNDTSFFSESAVEEILISHPIVVAQYQQRYRCVAGFRSLSIAVNSLCPCRRVQVISLLGCSAEYIEELSTNDLYLTSLALGLGGDTGRQRAALLQILDGKINHKEMTPSLKTSQDFARALQFDRRLLKKRSHA
ncbi:hypothetical protein SAMN05216296_0022 [Pseudomonas pohangensis]|uniref:Uncharacterized protein n=1 Tax=Pseudomonas pohangensis TaxID=364197 RepID=A0A1H2DUQ6_9PSED|nr:hypothetical protein [Pseudomonas pohangensis]SDT86590.1 hypothetical protein SAMN05216296_0022 [Pseudomonas pohangensis]